MGLKQNGHQDPNGSAKDSDALHIDPHGFAVSLELLFDGDGLNISLDVAGIGSILRVDSFLVWSLIKYLKNVVLNTP